jgi:hypothetical protein
MLADLRRNSVRSVYDGEGKARLLGLLLHRAAYTTGSTDFGPWRLFEVLEGKQLSQYVCH